MDPSYGACSQTRDDHPHLVEQPTHPQITVKSFDMPSIDNDEQEMEQVVIKQEAEEAGYEDYAYKCEATSTTEKPKCQESIKRHQAEKSHPGIENVVEKLKKNAAAALQESAPRKIEDSKEKTAETQYMKRQPETIPRKLENGLKKHILRSCENAQYADKHEIPREPEVSSSEATRRAGDTQDLSKYSATTEDPPAAKHPLPRQCFLNDNNNDTRSNNNNIKVIDDEEPVVKKEKASSLEGCLQKEAKFVDSGAPITVTPKKHRKLAEEVYIAENQTPKSRAMTSSKQKATVDISGLELLSNSIEQLEQLKPDAQSVATACEPEKSPVRRKLISPQGESNNNNVDSPLGLLCALAEQRFMEEVGGKAPRKLNHESSEEISHAGRLLLNLGRASHLEKEGKASDKRKLMEADGENYESPKRFKIDDEFENEESKCDTVHCHENTEPSEQYEARAEEDVVFGVKEKTRRSIDFSERNGVSVDDEEESVKDKPVGKGSPYKESDDERGESFGEYRQYEEYEMNGAYSEKIEGNFSDSDSEMYREKISLEAMMMARNDRRVKRRLSTGEQRDCHDYRNLQAKLDANKFIARKGHADSEADWPNMDAMELDMRVRLADIQRQYREKQRELSKLTPKKDEKKSPGRPRKKSHSSR